MLLTARQEVPLNHVKAVVVKVCLALMLQSHSCVEKEYLDCNWLQTGCMAGDLIFTSCVCVCVFYTHLCNNITKCFYFFARWCWCDITEVPPCTQWNLVIRTEFGSNHILPHFFFSFFTNWFCPICFPMLTWAFSDCVRLVHGYSTRGRGEVKGKWGELT